MKADKHKQYFIKVCELLAEKSECVRRKFAALIVDPKNLTIVSDGYNGWVRGGRATCAKDGCDRDNLNIASNESLHIGCVHSEVSAIINAARTGRAIKDMWMFVNGEPCMLCSKYIVHAGISRVYITNNYGFPEGPLFLKAHGVPVITIDKD